MGGWGRLFWPPTDPLVFFLVDFSDARRGFLCVCRCVCFRTFTKKKEKKNFKRYKTFGCRATGLPVTVVLKYEVQCMTQLLRSSFRMGQGVWEGSGSWRIVSTCPALSGRRTLVLLAKKKKKKVQRSNSRGPTTGVFPVGLGVYPSPLRCTVEMVPVSGLPHFLKTFCIIFLH